MKKELFERSFDSLDDGMITELYSGESEKKSFFLRIPRTLKIAASVVIVAAAVTAGAILLKSPHTQPVEDETPSQISASTGDTVSKTTADTSLASDDPQQDESYCEDPVEPDAYYYAAIDNVLYQMQNSTRAANNILGLNSESYSLWKGVYVTDTLKDALEHAPAECSVAVNIVPRLAPEEVSAAYEAYEAQERISLQDFVWKGHKVAELNRQANAAREMYYAVLNLYDLTQLGYTPAELYDKIEGNDLYGLDREFLDTLAEKTDEGYLLDAGKIKALAEEYDAEFTAAEAALREAQSAYYEQYPPVVYPVEELNYWFEYWTAFLDENGIEYTVTDMGYFLIVPSEEFDRIAATMSVSSTQVAREFGVLFGLTFRSESDNTGNVQNETNNIGNGR